MNPDEIPPIIRPVVRNLVEEIGEERTKMAMAATARFSSALLELPSEVASGVMCILAAIIRDESDKPDHSKN